jgi:hypothetical protein
MFVSSNTGRIIESFTFRYSKGTLIVIAVFCCNVEINYVVYEKWPAIDLCVSRFCWLSLFFFFVVRETKTSNEFVVSKTGKVMRIRFTFCLRIRREHLPVQYCTFN